MAQINTPIKLQKYCMKSFLYLVANDVRHDFTTERLLNNPKLWSSINKIYDTLYKNHFTSPVSVIPPIPYGSSGYTLPQYRPFVGASPPTVLRSNVLLSLMEIRSEIILSNS